MQGPDGEGPLFRIDFLTVERIAEVLFRLELLGNVHANIANE